MLLLWHGAFPAKAEAQSGRLWRAQDRVLVSDFDDLGAVATDGQKVYAASPYGLQIYDANAGRWDPPVTGLEGYPVGEQPNVLAWDPLNQNLWLATGAGGLHVYQPFFERWENRGFTGAGVVLRIEFPPHGSEGPAYIRTTAGWFTMDRDGFSTRPEPASGPPGDSPASPAGALAGDPLFESLRGTLTTDDNLRRWPITGLASHQNSGEYWISTEGGNLFRYSDFAGEVEQFEFGLLTRGAGSVLVAGDDVWFGGDGTGSRRGVARSDTLLQGWDRYEARFTGAPSGMVREMLSDRGSIWFAAGDGLFRFDLAGEAWSRIDELSGLPSDDVRSLAPAPGGVWAGTRLGLRRFGSDGAPIGPAHLTGASISGLSTVGDTLWIATDRGLWIRPPGAAADIVPTIEPAPGLDRRPELRGGVRDVASGSGFVGAITESALFEFEGGEWIGPIREPARGGLGRLERVVAADGMLWISGQGGVGRRSLDGGNWVFHMAGDDLPSAPVLDLTPAGDDVWLATLAGALRLRWRR